MISFTSGRFASGERDTGIRSIGVRMGPGFNIDALEERKFYCLWAESKHRLSYIPYSIMNNRRKTKTRNQVRLILRVIYWHQSNYSSTCDSSINKWPITSVLQNIPGRIYSYLMRIRHFVSLPNVKDPLYVANYLASATLRQFGI
jgi:hypothetical protein